MLALAQGCCGGPDPVDPGPTKATFDLALRWKPGDGLRRYDVRAEGQAIGWVEARAKAEPAVPVNVELAERFDHSPLGEKTRDLLQSKVQRIGLPPSVVLVPTLPTKPVRPGESWPGLTVELEDAPPTTETWTLEGVEHGASRVALLRDRITVTLSWVVVELDGEARVDIDRGELLSRKLAMDVRYKHFIVRLLTGFRPPWSLHLDATLAKHLNGP